MKLRDGLFALILLAACSKPATKDNEIITREDAESTESNLMTQDATDSSTYIGRVYKFENPANHNSVYIELYLQDNVNLDLFGEITGMGDSLIFQDVNQMIRRTRLPIEKVGKYFKLGGLDKIDIYDGKNQKLATGRFSHIEYYEQSIRSEFVAVFDVDDPKITGYSYCTTWSNQELTPNNPSGTTSIVTDEKLNSLVIDHLKPRPEQIWNIQHYALHNYFPLNTPVIYSVVSADTTAFIVESVNKVQTTLYRSTHSESINEVTIISRQINGRPILLINGGKPETDWGWTSVLVFNGTQYEVSKHQRVKDW